MSFTEKKNILGNSINRNMFSFMVLTYLIMFCSLVLGNHYSTILIKDVIKSFNYPASVLAFLCSKQESVLLTKELSDINVGTGNYNSFKKISMNVPPNNIVFVVDFQCGNVTNNLYEANALKLFASPYKWIILLEKDIQEKYLLNNYFANINILVDSHVTLANKLLDTKYSLTKIFKLNKSLNTEIAGFWILGKGVIDLETTKVTARRRKNLAGAVLRTCLVITNNDSLNHLTDNRNKHVDTIAKVNYALVQHLGDIVNATQVYSVQSTWGYKNNNSQWSGMIGELQREEADIGGTPLFVTPDRISVIDYVAMTTPTRSKFVFRQPKLSFVTNVFTLPFQRSVWISMLALLVVTALGLLIVVKWEWYKTRVARDTELNALELQDTWMEVFFVAFCALCQQGSSTLPLSVPGRIITILLFISLMFLYTSYSANIVALLQSSSSSIKTLKDLLHSRISVGVDDNVFNHHYFSTEQEPIRRAIYLQKVAPPGQIPRYYPINEGVKKMREGLFAFHMETGAGYGIVGRLFEEHEKCGLREIQYLQVPDPWLSVQKNSSYKEMLKIGLHQIQESGLQDREVWRLYTKKPQCMGKGSSFVNVSLVDCYPAVAVLAVGIVSSLFVLLFELYTYHRLKFKLARLSNKLHVSPTYLN